MERAVVVGNCQAKALELMLLTSKPFTERFELVSFPAVHEIPDALVPELHRAVADATVVIVQRVEEGYRDGIGLGSETLAAIAGAATVVRWPSVYWAGYFPDLFYLRDAAGAPVVAGPFDYHDRVVLEAYAAGLDQLAALRLLGDVDRPSEAVAWAERATAELALREAGCDVRVSAFIASRFRDELLFFTMNHPANRLLGFIAQEILELVGLPGGVDEGRFPEEILGSTFYPLHATHVRALDLGFGGQYAAPGTPFRIRGVRHEPAQAVGVFYDYYAAHPSLVELNRAVPAR